MPDDKPLFAERLRALLDYSSDALLVTTLTGEVLDCNRSTLEMFGYPRAEIIGKNRVDLVAPGDQRLTEAVKRRDSEGMVRSPLSFVRRDKTRFDGEVISVVGRSPSGEDQVWVVVRDFSDRRRAEAADAELRRSNALLQALSDAAFEAVFMHRDGVIWSANRAAELYVGVEPGGLIGRRLIEFIAPESVPGVLARIANGDDQPYDSRALRSDGTSFPVEVQTRTIPGEYGVLRVVVLRDLTLRRQLEEQLRQAQKLDAIGHLAGGIAHDFNNLLSVILSASDLALMQLPPEHQSRAELDEVIRAAERAAALTRQLLAFGRKQVLRPQVVDVNRILAGMTSMLRRVVAEDIELDLRPSPEPATIRADPAQLEQVVLNLVVNARDAMPSGGRLSVEIRNVTLDRDSVRAHPDLEPGAHTLITIADTGVGMGADTRAHIFEPFFTTKAPGQGTGLGLSTVFGIIKQSGGAIAVESEPGRGSSFTLHFPRVEAEPESAPNPAPEAEVVSQASRPSALADERPVGLRDAEARRILVVEDDARVRRVVVEFLRQAGYQILEADHPSAALELAARHHGEIDLLLTDVVMPELSGQQLVERLVAADPGLRVLYMSGHPEDSIVDRGVLAPGVRLLTKPVFRDRLLAAVQAALG